MAIYAELFDGSLLEFPDGTDQSVINRVAQEETLKRQPAGPSGMVPAMKAGAQSLMGELALLRGKVGLLSPEEAEQRYAERQMAARRAFTPTEKGWTEDFAGKFGELLGGSLPYMAAPLAAGVGVATLPVTGTAATLGALGLAGAVSGAQFTGSNLARQMEAAKERGEAGTLEATSLPAAAGAAVPQAALDIIGFRATPLIRKLFSSVGKEISEDAAQSLINQSFGRIAADYAMATGTAMGVEGLTETAQQYLERLQAGLNIADEKAREEYLESFVGGAILGGAFGAPGRYFERQREIAQAELATLAPGQKPGETLTQTANRLSREIKSIDEILSPPAPEQQFANAKQLFEMAAQPDGAARLNAYAEQLRKQPESPERDKAIADTLTLYTQLVTEEKARKTPEGKEYPHGKEEPAEPAPPAPYPSFNALMDMVRTSPDATQAVQRLDEYAAAVRNLPATTERADHLRSVAELRKIVKAEEEARKPAGGPEAFKLKPSDLREAGINRADPLYHQIVNKDINNPEDYEYVLRRLENALDRPKLSPTKYASIEGLIDALEANLARIEGSGFYARPTVYEPSGAGAGVVSGDVGQPAAEGLTKPKRPRVVRAKAYVGPSVPGEEAEPAPVDLGPPYVEGPEPGLDAALDRPATKAVAELEKELRAAQRIRKPNLFSTLMGQLDVQEVKDIGTSGDVVERQFRPLIKSGGQGGILGDIVSDGTLDAFLPYDLRHDAPSFDALEASEFIKEKLRQRSHLSYETEQLLARINLSINDLLPTMEAEEIENEIQRTLREINASLQEAAAEQRERVEEITVPPAEEPARGAERVAKPEKPAGLTPRQQKIEFGAATGAARAESLRARNNPKLLAAVKAGNIKGIIAALSNSKNRLIAFIGQQGMPAGVTVKIDNEAGEQYIGRSVITDLITISYAKNLLALRDALPNNTPFESVRVLNQEGDLTQDLSKPSDLSFMKGIDGWWMWGYKPITGTEQQRLNHLKDWVDSEVQRVGEDRLKLNATASAVRTGVPGGSYDANTKVISLDEYWAKSEGVVGHEVVHAQTLAAIANPTAAQKPYVKQLEDLFDHVKKSVDELKKTARFPDSYEFYGLSSLQEFIAEGMSNPQFQFILNTIPYKQKSAWSNFVDSLAKLLGITDNTAFTELVSIYESLNKPKQSLRDVTKGVPEAKFKELEQRAKKPREEAAPAPEAEEDQAVAALKAQKALKASQLQGVLKKILSQYGLQDVELNLEEGMKNEGSYSGLLIKLALDNIDPVRVLRHESVHALKELGFFTPQQWKVLTDRANKEWIDTFLKERNIDGLPLESGQQSRYDAYMAEYNGDEEAVMEEAIADAFAYFNSTKAPTGMMSAILNRMRNLFKAIKQAMNLGGYETAEDVFGAIEKGKLKPAAPTEPTERFSLRTKSPEFQFWFGQSKIVDEKGQPKVMYHGTGKDYEILGTARRQAKAIFVTDDPKFAEQFAKDTFAKAAVEAAQGRGVSPESYKRGVDRAIAAVRKDYGNRPEGKEMIAGIRLGYNDANAEAQEYMRNAFKDELPAGPNIIPVYVKADNPFDYENADHVKQIKALTATLKGVAEDSSVHANMMREIGKGNWEVIEDPSVQDAIRTLGFDGFYVKEQGRKSLAVYEPNQLKSVFNDKPTTRPELRLSLRTMPTLATDVTNRVTQTIAPRIRPGYIERIQDAISPRGYSFFRKEFVNRYEAQARNDRAVAEQIRLMGGTEQLADVKAESAALSSDLGGGLAAAAYGVHDRRGGYPVYKKRYLVEKDFLQLGTYDTKAAADAAARKYGAQVYEIGHTTISNEGDIEGLIAIFSPLMKYEKPAPGEPDVFSLYQFWADVKRASRYIQNQATGKYEEKLFNDPKDIKRAKEIEQQYPEFKDIQEKWIKYNDKLVDFMRDTGVISAQGAIEMKAHGDYFPFYRHLGENDVQGPKLFSSISGVRAPKAAKGSEAQVTDFFETVVRNTQSAIQAGIKNIAARRATDQALRLKSVQQVQGKATGPAAYRVLEDGKEVYYEADDLMFVESLKSLNQTDIPGLGLIAFPAQLLRALITKEPAFMLANMMRDSVSAWQTSGIKMTPIVATLKQFGNALAGTSPELDALFKAGVIGGYDYSSGVEKSAKQLEAEMRKQAKALTTMEKITALPRGVWAALEKGSTASDAATRMEIYKKVLAETNNEAEALWQSLEVMNFNRKGRSPVIRILTAAVPFLNARIQGLDVLYRTGIRPALAADSTEAEQQRFRTFWKRGVMMMGLAGLYWALTHDDDDYKKQEQETRDNYWLIPSLGVKIPIAFEVGFMFKVVPERLLQLAFGSDTGEDFLKSMGRQLHSTLGVGLPQIINPAVEVAANYSFFTQRPIVGQGLEGVAPKYQIGPNTSSMAAILGQSLNISPTKLDHLFQGYFGTMGAYAVNLVDSFVDMNSEAPKASKRLEQLPVLKRFLVDPESRGMVTSYYEFKNSVDEVVRTSNYLQRSQDFQGYQDYLKDNVRMLSARDYVNDLEKTMKQFREMKNAIRISQMSPDAKRDALVNIGRLEQNLTANIQFLKKNLKQ